MSELVKHPKGITVQFKFMGPDGQPINPFGSRIVMGDPMVDMKR